MDENASRAVFLGVSVFVAIITLTLILNFYRTARESASVANRYDIAKTDNNRINEILSKKSVLGLELRYLLNNYYNENSVKMEIYQPIEENGENREIIQDIDLEKYWSDATQQALDELIRPNYNYQLEIDDTNIVDRIVATFEY